MLENNELQPFSIRDEETISFISEDLKGIVLRILKEGTSPLGLAAAKELHERAERQDPYLIASSVYDYLWKKVASGERRNLYSLVGDFFLTALEQQLNQIGPNNMTSRFTEIMECYKGSGDFKRTIEGPLYCVDLFLLKTSQLVLSAKNRTTTPIDRAELEHPEQRAFYLENEEMPLDKQIEFGLQLARTALLDTQGMLSKLIRDGHNLNEDYIAFIRTSIDRLTLSLRHWQEMHEHKDIAKLSPDVYFKQGISRAESVNSLVLAAMLLEQVGEEYQDKMCREFLHHRFSNRPKDHPLRGCTFDAGEIYRDQGVIERESGAYILSERRFTRAISLFDQLHDRTSVAHSLIERARLYMLRPTELWKARDDLYRAAQNIAAVQKRIPAGGPLPQLTSEQVQHFYEFKGLAREAQVWHE